MRVIREIIRQHKSGHPAGIFSVCSAHPLVIKATINFAKHNNGIALVEATSNQVNQDGGYTGMQPPDFVRIVHDIADEVRLPRESVLFGGDHLGPNCWRDEDAESAMQKSMVLIDRYVSAGFRKIHLDCSMPCNDDALHLPDDIVANRAAQLCVIAENAWQRVGGEAPVYVVGTEVPAPGGAREDLQQLVVTSAEGASATVQSHRRAFEANGLEHVWPRVIGLVVQPGVEFDHHKVIDYLPERAKALSKFINSQENMVFEAHSTDYQSPDNLKRLVIDHFAILKVGPALTFALREALWGLDHIEIEWLGADAASQLRSIVVKAMQDSPRYWQSHHDSSSAQLALDLQYSLSDRIRYYWANPQVVAALSKMSHNFDGGSVPHTLISQYLPAQYLAIRSGEIPCTAEALAMHKVAETLQDYANACMR